MPEVCTLSDKKGLHQEGYQSQLSRIQSVSGLWKKKHPCHSKLCVYMLDFEIQEFC